MTDDIKTRLQADEEQEAWIEKTALWLAEHRYDIGFVDDIKQYLREAMDYQRERCAEVAIKLDCLGVGKDIAAAIRSRADD